MSSLISAEQHWALWAVLLSAAAFGLWAERTSWGSRLSGAVIAIGTTFVLSNARIIPVSAPAYDVVWSYFVPLAIPLLLFRANLQRILKEAGPTLLAFVAGGVGTVLGTLLAYRIIPLGPEGYKLAGIFCSTYIGGGMNYVATSQTLDLQSGDLMTAGIAADNLVMTLYFLLLFALPSIGFIRKRYIRRHEAAAVDDTSRSGPDDKPRLDLTELALALGLAAVICAIGYGVAGAIGVASSAILIVTAIAVLLASVFPSRLSNLSGASETGTLLMQVFFAAFRRVDPDRASHFHPRRREVDASRSDRDRRRLECQHGWAHHGGRNGHRPSLAQPGHAGHPLRDAGLRHGDFYRHRAG